MRGISVATQLPTGKRVRILDVTTQDGFRQDYIDTQGLTVGPAAVDSLDVWIDVDGGAVKGSISTTKKSPMVVVLASRTSRQRPGDFLRATGLESPSEPFIFSGVPPGLYSLFAFELTSIDEILRLQVPTSCRNIGIKAFPSTLRRELPSLLRL